MNRELENGELRQRWDAVAEPAYQINDSVFGQFLGNARATRQVLNCATPVTRGKNLTDFAYPSGWDLNKCLISSVGRGKLPADLEQWDYEPQIQAVPQLPCFKALPLAHSRLHGSPWFQSPSQALDLGINARHLRYHHNLWSELKPRVLRGVQTSIVFATPQLGWALTPHIKLDKAFHYFAALSRSAGPVQLFPADYLYPDAQLNGLKGAPAPIFADLLPFVGGLNAPVLDECPDPWGMLARFDGTDYFYGYPFRQGTAASEDITLENWVAGGMVLPNGKRVQSRASRSIAYATLDRSLHSELKLDREGFQVSNCLLRGIVTHDGLPFQLPVEMRAAVYALVTTAWEMELDKPGDLTSYTLKTRHAAIRGYNFFQRIEPYFSNFMRLPRDLAKEAPSFCVYPLSTHLTHSWLGGNLMLANQISESERIIGPTFQRSYYHQQLDWMMGVFNLWNQVDFRGSPNPERCLSFDGLAFHQMQPQLQFDSHLFQRPLRRASFWPDFNPDWLAFDQAHKTRSLPRPE